MAANNPKLVFKILIIGDTGVGKSCILHRYSEDKFVDQVSPTIGVDYRPVYRKFGAHLTKLMIWDTAGQEKYKSITTSFYHGAHGAVVVYDVTQRNSLYHVQDWVSDLRRVCGTIPLIIVGNKYDSRLSDRMPDDEIIAFIGEMGLDDRHFFTSAVTMQNISEAFEELVKMLMDSVKAVNLIDERKISLSQEHSHSTCSC